MMLYLIINQPLLGHSLEIYNLQKEKNNLLSHVFLYLEQYQIQNFDNSPQFLGDEFTIDFWLYPWCDKTFIDTSSEITYAFTNSHIPLDHKVDESIWNYSSSGSLTLKETYLHLRPLNPHVNRSKKFWNSYIPPSISLLVLRFMHNKMLSDSNLELRGCRFRGCRFPYMCNICKIQEDITLHIFFNCQFAVTIWSWFNNLINLTCFPLHPSDLWSLLDPTWSSQCQLVINATIINIINVI